MTYQKKRLNHLWMPIAVLESRSQLLLALKPYLNCLTSLRLEIDTEVKSQEADIKEKRVEEDFREEKEKKRETQATTIGERTMFLQGQKSPNMYLHHEHKKLLSQHLQLPEMTILKMESNLKLLKDSTLGLNQFSLARKLLLRKLINKQTCLLKVLQIRAKKFSRICNWSKK